MSRIHAMDGEVPAGPGLFEVNGHDPQKKLITNVRRVAGAERTPGSLLIGISTGLLALLGAGCFYVSWWGQYLFIFAAKQQAVPAQIQAGMLDAGMVILSGLSLGLARQGKPSRAERVLIQLCAAGSAAMNYLAADDASPRSVIVFTAAPVFAGDHHRPGGVGDPQARAGDQRGVRVAGAGPGGARPGAGHGAAGAVLAAVRPRAGETASGVRRMVLDAAPLPGVAAVTAGPVTGRGTVPIAPVPDEEPSEDEEPPAFGSKREAFEWHYRRHPQFGDRAAMSQVARLVGERVGLQWGTARTYAAAILAADAISDAMDAAREDEEAQR